MIEIFEGAEGFLVEVLADSVPMGGGDRLTTMRWTYPRFIHSECMTHRQFSRCAASSRAMRTEKIAEQVRRRPAEPVRWGKAGAGMQDHGELSLQGRREARDLWLKARDAAVSIAQEMEQRGVAKQIANRLIEPWMTMRSIWSATEEGWVRLLFLRDHRDAQPEFQQLAKLVRKVYTRSKPRVLKIGEWHTPLCGDDIPEADRPKVSAARCARVSYNGYAGKSAEADLRLFSRLVERPGEPRHLSPLEHVAKADPGSMSSGNFGRGWVQLREQYEQQIPAIEGGAS